MGTLPKIAIIGYGRMGKEIEEIAQEQGYEITEIFDIDTPILPNVNYNFDVAIDFSASSTTIHNAEIVSKLRKKIVIGTTGWYDKLQQLEEIININDSTGVYSSNFSIGMNIFFKIVDNASKLINQFEQFDISVNEIHHKNKIDHPSGTALTISDIILSNINRKNKIISELQSNSPIKAEELNVSYSRIGSVMGNHSVIIDSELDTITLSHNAKSRKGFASGALFAANWIIKNNQQKGLINFKDII